MDWLVERKESNEWIKVGRARNVVDAEEPEATAPEATAVTAPEATSKPVPARKVQPISKMLEEFVGLNVGGVVYRTSVRTLVQHRDSLLGVMFTAGMPTPLDEDGNYMIDADGPMFRHVLNFMRRGVLSLPNDFKEYNLLYQEAKFFQLPDLVAKVSGAVQCPGPSQFIEAYVSEDDDEPQTWRIHGSLVFLEKVPVLADYIHLYRKGSQCVSFTTQHPMFPSHTFRRFPKSKLFCQICEIGFRLHSTDCVDIIDKDDVSIPWLRYLFVGK